MDEELGYQVFPANRSMAVSAPTFAVFPARAAYAEGGDVAPTYSDATRAYFDKLNSYIGSLGAAPFGTYEWAMPKQSYTNRSPYAKESEFGFSIDDPDRMPITAYTSDEEYAPYITKPVEENAIYRFNVPSNKNTSTGLVSVGYNTPVMLIDNRTGQVVSSGVGFDAARQIADAARNLSTTQGNKAEWSIYTGPAGATDPSQFKQVAQETKNKGFLGTIADIVGTALPIAVGFIPGLQGVGAVLASAGAGGVGAALRGQDILKGIAMGGLSAAGGQYLGDAITGATNIGANAARAIGTGIGSTAGGVVTGQDFGNALLGGITSGGLSYLGGELLKPGTRTTTGADSSGSTGGADSSGSTGGGGKTVTDAITVTGTRIPSLAAPVVNLGPTNTPPKTSQDLENVDLNPLTVTGVRTPALTSSTFSIPGITPAPQEILDLAAKSTEELPPEEVPAEDQITVTGARNPALTSSTFTVPSVTPVPQEILDLANQPAKDEIVVTGEKDAGTGSASVDTSAGTLNPDEIVVTAAKDAKTGSSTVNIPSITAVPQDIIDLANQLPKDEIVVTGAKDAKTGSASVDTSGGTLNPDEIVVTAAKDAKTGSSTVNIPSITPVPQDIIDLANKDTTATDDTNKFSVKELLALLGLVGGAGGSGGTGTGTGGKFQSVFSQKLPVPGQDGALMVGGLKGPTKGAAGTYSARPVTDWYRFGMGPAMDIPVGTDLSAATSPYAGYGPGTLGEETFKAVSGVPAEPTGKAHGGSMGYARGSSRDSFAVEGPGTGRSDDIPAVLSDGEYVIDAETVALLGDGSSKAGAKKLDQMRVNIRKHKGRNLAKGKFSVNAKAPERYLSGGRA